MTFTNTNVPIDFISDKNGYDNHFCMCIKDPICCLGACFCMPCTVGRTKAIIDGDKTFDIWSCLCVPIGAYRNRRRVNELYSKTESEDGSMCAVMCCTCCAVAQDGHEARVHKVVPENDIEGGQPTAVEAPSA